MQLDYELVRALKCAELMGKGFMIRPRTRVYQLCSDVVPIVAFEKEQKERDENPLLQLQYLKKMSSFVPNKSEEKNTQKQFQRFRVFDGTFIK